MLSKEQILSITDKATKEINVPEWGGTIFLKALTFEDQDYFDSIADDKDQNQKMLIRIVCDADGNPLFSEEDIPALKKKSLPAFKLILKEFKAFNGFEEAEKNSESTPA